MAEISPFKGVLYNSDKIKDISSVTAPPYDVISPEEQEHLYNSNPHNIIHILFGKDFPTDNEGENKYTRAKSFLGEWQKNGVLERDSDRSIYVYLQEFEVEGKTKSRLGFMALLKLEDFDTEKASIHPHENTLSAPKKDRSSLINSIEANLGPIFAIFADEDKAIDVILAQETKSKPIIDIVDHHGVRNKLWRVRDKARVERIVRLMKDKKLFIADGHHRYEVGLEFSKTKKDSRFGYILTYFTDIYADGMVILPTHRLITGAGNSILSELINSLKKDFKIKCISSEAKVEDFLSNAVSSEKRFVVYEKGIFTGLTFNDSDSLDVALLHDVIIEPLKKKAAQEGKAISIDFTKDVDYAVKMVDEGKFSFSILLNPTKITEVRDMAFSGKRMPQKSTYFYPKVLTGLVINVF